ncbi:MAG: NAD(P)-binding protein [Gammaproteobacteria bacterium]|nr:NAD(P)-binding protein [Gammaproteobacteria bacterium]
MAVSKDELNKKLTFRRYEEGDHEPDAWDEQIFQASWSHKCPTYVHRTPPCQGSCPAGEDIRGWLDIVRGMEKPPKDVDYQEYAFQRSTNANPFPSIMGRVCPAPCQDGCNRNEVDDFVGINAVEQFIGDTALEKGYKLAAAGPDTGKKVAIIGGGPAGMAAAYQLRRMGHAATIFDDREELGGMMRYGIPGYRTPRDVLDGEIKRIIDMGVETKMKTRVGRDISMDEVEKEYDAVLWALGAQSGRALPVPGTDADNCISGVAFLSAFNEGRLQHVTGKVVVVGGGDTSIDVASVARRIGNINVTDNSQRPEYIALGHTAQDVASAANKQGADVTLISRHPVDNMTAADHEVQDALREGVEIIGCVNPIEVVLGADGRATGLKVADFDEKTHEIVPGTERVLEAELIVSAIGQTGDFEGIETFNNGKGLIDADPNYAVKGKKGHFVAGDIIRPHLLTTAIGQASIAVQSIDDYLNAKELDKRPKVDVHHFNLLEKLQEAELAPEAYAKGEVRGTSDANFAIHNYEDRSEKEIIKANKLFLGHFGYEPRHLRDHKDVSAEEVLGHFEERIVNLSEDIAKKEAERCMSCGMCFECDNCVVYCPQDAVKKTPRKQSTTGRYVYTDYDRCIGCHICADVCPTGYIDMGLGE